MNASCKCNVCSGSVAFEWNRSGDTVPCPHCGMDTILFAAYPPPPPSLPEAAWHKPKERPDPASFTGIFLICLKVLGCLWIIGFFLWLLKALLGGVVNF